jgi:hypothetical protein
MKTGGALSKCTISFLPTELIRKKMICINIYRRAPVKSDPLELSASSAGEIKLEVYASLQNHQ